MAETRAVSDITRSKGAADGTTDEEAPKVRAVRGGARCGTASSTHLCRCLSREKHYGRSSRSGTALPKAQTGMIRIPRRRSRSLEGGWAPHIRSDNAANKTPHESKPADRNGHVSEPRPCARCASRRDLTAVAGGGLQSAPRGVSWFDTSWWE